MRNSEWEMGIYLIADFGLRNVRCQLSVVRGRGRSSFNQSDQFNQFNQSNDSSMVNR
jgi:hypothetical protein